MSSELILTDINRLKPKRLDSHAELQDSYNGLIFAGSEIMFTIKIAPIMHVKLF